jgi:preprotein translocase subunit SecG
MTTPDPVADPTPAAPVTYRPQPMTNATRVALVALALFVAVLIAGFLPLQDSADTGCGSAFAPGPESVLDAQTTECAFRTSAQQGFVYPLLLVSLAVAAGGFAWRTQRPDAVSR